MHVLALSGSLRAASHNSALLRAAARMAPAGMAVEVYPRLGELPLFNPDLESSSPAPVEALRRRINAAHALVIASPEYAHGISGVMKNALDWMVGNETFVDKPVALWNAAPRATLALAALRETVTTMSARIVEDACIAVPVLGSGLDEDGLVAQAEVRAQVVAALEALRRAPGTQDFASAAALRGDRGGRGPSPATGC